MAGEKIPKTKEKKQSEKVIADALLINAALDENISTKTGISEATGLAIYHINNIFARDKKLYTRFKIIRGTLADKAADNLQTILEDKQHPSHFQATKYILSTYKTDLDESMVEKKDSEIGVEVGKSGKNPIKITFSK